MSYDDYDRSLMVEGRDLAAEAEKGDAPPVLHREGELADALRHLDEGRSVLLVGAQGVGKTAVVRQLAQRLFASSKRQVFQVSTTTFLVGTRYIGEWQTKATCMAEAAGKLRAVVFLTDIWNLPKVGRTSQNDGNLLDTLRPFIESGRLTLLGEVSPTMLASMGQVPGFTSLFQQVRVEPLEPAAVSDILDRAVARLPVQLDASGREALVRLTGRFLAARPQPGPALDLLRQVVDYHAEKCSIGEPEPLDRAFIEKVFSIYSGLPRFVTCSDVTLPIREMRAWFHDRIIGQAAAVDAVVEAITLFKAGLHDPTKPIGTFLFVGPTGVGKTELARALATFLFGSDSRMLRFDLSEFKDYHAFDMLVGNPQKPDQPARLVDPVRARPFQVVLFDELEKAHANIWDLFLQLLDEGRLSPPQGEPVDFRNTIVIATSNVGGGEAGKALGFGPSASMAALERGTRGALEQAFRPEFLNRFQHVVVFEPLTHEQLLTIARHELRRVLVREGIVARNLVVEVDDGVLGAVIERGCDSRYGARALKREIQRQLVLPLAIALTERPVEPGSILKAVHDAGRIRVRVLDTPQSRAVRQERAPVEPRPGRKLDRRGLALGIAKAQADISGLVDGAQRPRLREQLAELTQASAEPGLWDQPDRAARVLRDLDQATRWLDRLEGLVERAEELELELTEADSRGELARLADRLISLEQLTIVTRRELVYMGPVGHWDALVQITPLGGRGQPARDMLAGLYRGWAGARRMPARVILEPMDDEEPALLLIQGSWAAGYLAPESGLHRMKLGKDGSVARVRVVPWTDTRGQPEVIAQRALKKRGAYDGRVRSRLECAGGLVLQNAGTLTENRDLARELVSSWLAAPPPCDDQVRSYYQRPHRLVDSVLGRLSGRRASLEPANLHRLLCERLDVEGSSGDGE